MSRLGKALKKLGYDITYDYRYGKTLERTKEVCSHYVCFYVDLREEKITSYCVKLQTFTIEEQFDIDMFQEAYDVMQKDLEILKECEE